MVPWWVLGHIVLIHQLPKKWHALSYFLHKVGYLPLIDNGPVALWTLGGIQYTCIIMDMHVKLTPIGSLSLSLSLFPQPTSPSIGVHPFSAFIPGVHNMVACKWKPPRTLWNKADQQQGKIANVPYGKVIDMNSKGVRTLNCHLTHSHWLAL
jgi:hypothetical protein